MTVVNRIDDIDKLAGKFRAKAPEPGPAEGSPPPPIAQEEPKAPPTQEFDPEIHEVDPVTGQPARRRDGTFKLKRGKGSPKVPRKTTVTPRPSVLIPGEEEKKLEAKAAEAADLAKQREALSAMVVDGVTGSVAMVLGEDWVLAKDKNNAERNHLIDATSVYLESTGVNDIPPGALLALAICMYAAPRLSTPKTQNRLAALLQAIKRWFNGLAAKKQRP